VLNAVVEEKTTHLGLTARSNWESDVIGVEPVKLLAVISSH
jgi:hypothetical protein